MFSPHFTTFLIPFFISFVGSLFFGFLFITYAPTLFRGRVREYTPEQHQQKNLTPTMGGIFIIAATLVGSLLSGYALYSPATITLLFSLLLFGLIGFVDDWNKLVLLKGISARAKFIAQWGAALIIAIALVFWLHTPTTLNIPILHWNINLGPLYIPWAMFVIVATCNAVNLTDGLDGLAATVILPNLMLFGPLALCSASFFCAREHYLLSAIEHSPIALVTLALIGALLGFLWYNTYPAKVFMGDVGSLALGAFYATLALMTKQELLIPVAGGIFVLETVSVMLQVFWYKRYGKRLFKIAPIHHHFELSGWPETRITLIFGLCSFLLSVLAAFIIFY